MPHTTTKKIRNNPLHNKKELWDMFDQSIKDSDEPIECVYDKKENDCCNVCESPLYHTDEVYVL